MALHTSSDGIYDVNNSEIHFGHPSIRIWAAGDGELYFEDTNAGTHPLIDLVGGGGGTSVATVIVAADGSGDYDNIQDGIDALPEEGGLVWVKQGEFLITDHIEITNFNTQIVFNHGTKLIASPCGEEGVLFKIGFQTGKIRRISIIGLNWDGNRETGMSNYVHVKDVEFIKIIDCKIKDVGDASGIKLENTSHFWIERGNFSDNGFSGIELLNCSWGQIRGNLICRNGIDAWGEASGIFLEESTWISIIGNAIYDDQDEPCQGGATEEFNSDLNLITNNRVCGMSWNFLNPGQHTWIADNLTSPSCEEGVGE